MTRWPELSMGLLIGDEQLESSFRSMGKNLFWNRDDVRCLLFSSAVESI
jgi:hypothetical protein